jgi:Dullard-like phosphatase family protein
MANAKQKKFDHLPSKASDYTMHINSRLQGNLLGNNTRPYGNSQRLPNNTHTNYNNTFNNTTPKAQPTKSNQESNIFRKTTNYNQSDLSNNLNQTSTSLLKEKSIVPSESYAQEVGSGRLGPSPQIQPKLVKRVTVNSAVMNETEYYNLNKQKSRKAQRSRKSQKEETDKSPTISQRRAELQENYKKKNTMSHTPDPKSSNRLQGDGYIKRSLTPEQKKANTFNENKPEQAHMFQMLPLLNRKYTLVLDLDETLIHFKTENGKSKFLIRPHTYKFLRNLHPMFELIIFTAAQQQYADWIINKIDTKKYISYRFYRTHCNMSRSAHIKDLTRLSRSLATTIIVDNCKENFKLQKGNGIHIRGWFGNTEDRVLVELENILKEMVNKAVPDVRLFLRDTFVGRTDGDLSLY